MYRNKMTTIIAMIVIGMRWGKPRWYTVCVGIKRNNDLNDLLYSSKRRRGNLLVLIVVQIV